MFWTSPSGLKLAQGFPDRHPRHSEEFRKLDLVESFAILELPVVNGRTQRSGQIVGDGFAFAQIWIPLHARELMRADLGAGASTAALLHAAILARMRGG